MVYSHRSEDLTQYILQLIHRGDGGEGMLLEMMDALGTNWQVMGCLWMLGDFRDDFRVIRWQQEQSKQFNIVLQSPMDQGIVTTPLVHRLMDSLGVNATIPTSAIAFDAISEQENFRLTNAFKIPLVSALGIRTQFQGKVKGFLLVGYDYPHQWTKAEKTRLENIAPLFAIATHLFQQQQPNREAPLPPPWSPAPKVYPPLSNAISSIIRKFYTLMQRQLEEQRLLIKLKDDFITAISHETGHPLTNMLTAIKILRRPNLSSETRQRYLDMLEQEFKRLNDLITRIFTFKKLESQELSYDPTSVNLLELLEEVTESLNNEWKRDHKTKLNLSFTCDPKFKSQRKEQEIILYTDSQHLKTILLELLDNARKFSTDHTTVTLDLQPCVLADQSSAICLKIINQGLPIIDEDIDHIFEAFRRGQGTIERAIAGTGIGLAVVKGLVNLLNGQITVTCQPMDLPKQAIITFSLTIPLSSPKSPV